MTSIDIFENPFSKLIGGFIVFAVRTYINLNFRKYFTQIK